ncbi:MULTISPECIES: RNA pyrophosphohydrolase [unclassified Gilliamella]|uniref:RNA pyrophosphohydrolase n=1 Tax=unclassified Gilliamella TaxID=2685620 RepID=UPI001C698E13|nr:RNA pyrophosphohydrolase [Gilliamella sp. ESL0441]QYN45303.1 RNA pyrophosphohydrolase [Gilliamella sp. ESL0441]
MIDNDGYRPNVGIVICNRQGQVLWARRYGQNSWQFPQGGIKPNETPEQAMFRELNEEVGLLPRDVKIISSTNGWLRYKLPKRMIRWENQPVCIGQKQKWFLLELLSDISVINLNVSATPEFDDWKWVSYWYPIRQVIAFKRDVYRKAMKEFSLPVFAIQSDVECPTTNNIKKRSNSFVHKRKNKQRNKK